MAVGELATADLETCHELAQQIRVDGIRCSTKAGSGHPTSSMSAADLITVLAARHLRYDFAQPHLPNNDHLIFSKGHASPLLYALYKATGAISDEELMTYRTHESRLQGHPTPILPWVDVATGSLGQGLPIATGVAMAGKYLDKMPYHVWVLTGDSELAEGSCWEAFDKASYYKLDNLTVIADINRLGQRGETEFGWHLETYRKRLESFGCVVIEIDGHDLDAIDTAFAQARAHEGAPTVILAKTIKGKGFSEIENKDGWHGKPLPPDMAERAIKELGGERNLRLAVTPPRAAEAAIKHRDVAVQLPTYNKGDKVATRKAYGDALVALGARPDVVALDGEVSNSTHSEEFQKAYPDRFFEMFIAEQQLVAAAVGMAVRGYVPFASTFAAFMSRAYDFIRMAGISRTDVRLSGSHAGCEIGADGPSQMALEDIAAMRAVHGSTVLYPCDAVSAAKLVEQMLDLHGISYLRTTRGAYPVIYDNSEDFRVGGSKTLLEHNDDKVTLVGAGVTVHNILDAARQLAGEGINCRVIDCYSVKPIDSRTLLNAAHATKDRIIVVEDHYPEGGLGSAVMEALAEQMSPPTVVNLAVNDLPGSGSTQDLMAAAGIDATAICRAVRELVAAET